MVGTNEPWGILRLKKPHKREGLEQLWKLPASFLLCKKREMEAHWGQRLRHRDGSHRLQAKACQVSEVETSQVPLN